MDKNNLYRNTLTGQSDLESMYHYQSINLKTLANRIASRCGVNVSHCDVLEGQFWFVKAEGQTEEKNVFVCVILKQKVTWNKPYLNGSIRNKISQT